MNKETTIDVNLLVGPEELAVRLKAILNEGLSSRLTS